MVHRIRPLSFSVPQLLASGLAAATLVACGSSDDSPTPVGDGEPAEEIAFEPLPPGNPFETRPLYVYPGTQAAQAAQQLAEGSPQEAELAAKIAGQPAAEWFSYPLEQIAQEVDEYVTGAIREGQLAVLVPYNVPNRDCGQYSAGGVQDPDAYRTWMQAFADAIGERPAVVIVEPDSLPLLDNCLDEAGQAERLALLGEFVQVLGQLPSTVVYLDAGHSSWISGDVMAERLRAASVEQARGFSLNVSNYQFDEDLVRYGQVLAEQLGPDTHFVIDSSRNGNGPLLGADGWCNPPGRALGREPQAVTDDSALDAYLWIKRPGESDGECRDGPAPGIWFPERAYELAREAEW